MLRLPEVHFERSSVIAGIIDSSRDGEDEEDEVLPRSKPGTAGRLTQLTTTTILPLALFSSMAW